MLKTLRFPSLLAIFLLFVPAAVAFAQDTQPPDAVPVDNIVAIIKEFQVIIGAMALAGMGWLNTAVVNWIRGLKWIPAESRSAIEKSAAAVVTAISGLTLAVVAAFAALAIGYVDDIGGIAPVAGVLWLTTLLSSWGVHKIDGFGKAAKYATYKQ